MLCEFAVLFADVQGKKKTLCGDALVSKRVWHGASGSGAWVGGRTCGRRGLAEGYSVKKRSNSHDKKRALLL